MQQNLQVPMQVPDLGSIESLTDARNMQAAEYAYQQSMRPNKRQFMRLQVLPVVLELVKTGSINISGSSNGELPTINNFCAALEKLTDTMMREQGVTN